MTNIAIVTGGISKERAISLASVETYIKHLSNTKYSVNIFDIPKDLPSFIEQIATFDLVIPVIHGIGGEDGQITALCELHNIPCFFTSSQSHQLCIDKFIATSFLKNHNIVVPETTIVSTLEEKYILKEGEKVFIKPVHGGSSIDSNVCSTQEQVNDIIKKIILYDQALVQEYIHGREFTVSVVGDWNGEVEVYAISEIITSQGFFDYEAKYQLKNTQEVTPAELSENLEQKIKETAINIYKACRINCLGRIDFIYQDNKLYCLEINTIPGFTETSFFPQAIRHRGLEINEFLDIMIDRILDKRK